MKYQAIELLNVFLNYDGEKIPVGRLALKNRRIYFEYNDDFIAKNIPLSPFQLPLKSGVVTCDDMIFDGLFGVFNDSLPDGWGRLLLDRQVEKYGIHRQQLTPLDRLAFVGRFGMGALSYEPVLGNSAISNDNIQLDKIALESQQVLAGEHEEVLEELFALNGSSAGARPKIVVGVNEDKAQLIHGAQNLPAGFSHWMIKFPSSYDNSHAGALEYTYSLMAKKAGIEMPETHLFETGKGRYFGIKRFDREGNQPFHMHSLCGLIHADHRTPSLDYETVLKVTLALTKNMVEVEKAFRLACFNVLAHNRDDHSKNFSFILDKHNQWQFAPAYDLTFSHGPSGEQSTMVMGEGKNPTRKHLRQLGRMFDIKQTDQIIDEVIATVNSWNEVAQPLDLPPSVRMDISKKIVKMNE